MLIGLSGKAGSGKDQSFQYIQDWAHSIHRPVRRDAFADRLKWSAARLFHPDISCEEAIEWANEIKQESIFIAVSDHEYGPDLDRVTGREFLQHYGTEAHRQIFGQDFWIEAVIGDLDSSIITVVTDVRFPNEAQAIKDAGGQMWEIVRPGEIIAESAHASEQALPSRLIDCVLVNSGDLLDLRNMVRSTLDKVLV